ncbi:hypothetical protein IGI04_002460 [Brassica rapa subsp. trilocularis]|uniref:Uncharacterized protein n=1 Tax=Brassica rapa subsp. trilocularis TaxID=1813537 RepID=A0ABQ7NVK9_BRACM|nr:hypothetical protein IGI04_002460 [Brassica rapa subsp. trilocularis]
MKRKGGHKKGNKSKKSTEPENLNESVQNSDSEQSSGECEKSKTEVDAPDSSPSVDPVKSVGRVKVKLKTSSKAPEPDVPLSTPQKEDPVPPRLPERKPVLNVYRKMKGIKIKSWKAVDGSSSVSEKPQDAVDKETKTPDETSQLEPDSAPVSSQKKTDNNKQELEDSLTVVKKIMKMEAADPFNVPVDPEALGIPNAQVEDGGNASSKGSQSKQKSQKRHGRHHKSDCMCAVCILKRRKRERHSSQGNSGAVEESSPVRSPSVDNSSINMREEQDMDVDVDNKTRQGKAEIVELDSPVAKRQRVGEYKKQNVEEEETLEVETETKTKPTVQDKTQSIDRSTEETGDEPVTCAAEKLAVLASVEGSKATQNEEEDKAKRLREQKELQELERKQWRAKMHEKFQLRNPQLLNLCETIFPKSNNQSSVWNGPHSLFKRPEGSNRTSSLHKAVEALMRSSS